MKSECAQPADGELVRVEQTHAGVRLYIAGILVTSRLGIASASEVEAIANSLRARLTTEPKPAGETPRVETLVQITDGGIEIYDRQEMLKLARQLERELNAARQELTAAREQGVTVVRVDDPALLESPTS